MKVYWLEQKEADVPTEDNWLSRSEVVRLGSFRFPKRRADWRLGRWTAKQGLAAALNLDFNHPALANIEIWPASSGEPEAFLNSAPAPASISISHREGRAMCAIARSDVRVGCDLEAIESHGDAFVADYFAPEEQQAIASVPGHHRERVVSLLWSAKESVLKALHEGLRLDTRTVIASFNCDSLNTEGWGSLQVRYDCKTFVGWWQKSDRMVRTIVADVASDVPICLPVGDCCASEVAA